MAGWLAAPAGGGFDARSVTEAADEIERLRAGVAEIASALEAQADVSLLSKIVASDLRALLAAATPKEAE
jgi:hypothetical protein